MCLHRHGAVAPVLTYSLILGYKSPIVKQGCFCAGDPVRQASNIARAFVVGLSTHVISNTISQGGDWKFVAWFVVILVFPSPIAPSLEAEVR